MSASLKVFLTLLCLFCATTKASATKSCEFSVRQLSYSLEENFVLEKVKSKKRYTRSVLKTQVKEFSTMGSELLEYQFDFYQTHQGSSKEAKPLVVLFPTINGVGFLEKQMARYMAKRGFHVLIPYARQERFSDQEDAAYHMDLELARAICGVELVVDQKREIFSFDTEGLAVVGASQGGIRGTTFFNRRPDAQALVTSVAASNMPSVYANSTQEKIAALKNRLLSLLELPTATDLQSYLSSALLIDPSDHADPARADSVRMLISVEDTVVPTRNQLELWEQMGRPQRQLLNSGHGASVLRMHMQRSQVLEFIKNQL